MCPKNASHFSHSIGIIQIPLNFLSLCSHSKIYSKKGPRQQLYSSMSHRASIGSVTIHIKIFFISSHFHSTWMAQKEKKIIFVVMRKVFCFPFCWCLFLLLFYFVILNVYTLIERFVVHKPILSSFPLTTSTIKIMRNFIMAISISIIIYPAPAQFYYNFYFVFIFLFSRFIPFLISQL